MNKVNNLESLFLSIEKQIKDKGLKNMTKLLKMYNSDDWKKHVEFKNESYNRKIFKSNDNFEIIIISWNKFQKSPIHDHPSNGCLMKILQGSLIERRYKNNEKLELKNENIYKENDVAFIKGDKIIHEIINKDYNTVSLHIYSPPNFKINLYKKEFRNYDNNFKVENTYKLMLENQTIDYVKTMKEKYLLLRYKKYKIWNLIDKFNEIIDESDPDNELPQIYHAYQTAEAIKEKYFDNDILKKINIKDLFNKELWNDLPNEYKIIYNKTINEFYNIDDFDWFILLGFIHDLGKVLLLDDFGSLPQWSVVGDTFPLGCKLNSNYVYFNKGYHNKNKDLNIDIYSDNCGFDNVLFSWGHDEYLASLLSLNNIKIPKEAIYIIRYHSFYSWHSPKNNKIGYKNLASNYDWFMLPLLKMFQKADLYSKTEEKVSIEYIKTKYNNLIDKYFNNKVIYC